MPVYKKVNKKFFKKWTPEMAYILGFFAADGSIDAGTAGGIYLSFHGADRDIIYKIRNAMGSEHKIAKRIHNKTGGVTYRMQIGSKEMCGDLLNLGLSENKTGSLCIPNVPEKMLGDFIRGYFDGDGNVWVGKIHKKRKVPGMQMITAFTSCSEKFLKELWSVLKIKGIGGGSLFGKNNAYRLQFSMYDSLLLADIMYDNLDCGLFLKRKKKVFEHFKKMRS